MYLYRRVNLCIFIFNYSSPKATLTISQAQGMDRFMYNIQEIIDATHIIEKRKKVLRYIIILCGNILLWLFKATQRMFGLDYGKKNAPLQSYSFWTDIFSNHHVWWVFFSLLEINILILWHLIGDIRRKKMPWFRYFCKPLRCIELW